MNWKARSSSEAEPAARSRDAQKADDPHRSGLGTCLARDDQTIVWYEGAGQSNQRWLHTDQQGSVIAVSDNTGVALAINSYDEYGIPASGNLGRFQYAGQAWLPELDMYN